MEISVVTGTYNRLKHLQRMVSSVRMSIGNMIPYELVIVDGGSTDGTIQWCLRQGDIQLIQQGELLGAIKAFNAGCFAANGRYVIIANDDIEFIRFSILKAYSFMQDHSNVGVGCFYQDRNDRDMHIETMPAVRDGKKTRVPYGQVCIVPKVLGDQVGWWGTEGHTYGGDNELSCNVLEAGFTVHPLECCCIHDFQLDDDLRVQNDGYPAIRSRTGKTHPDTVGWRERWTHPNGYVGPNIGSKPLTTLLDAPERYFRIYYAPIYEKDHKLQHKYKKTLREVLQERGTVFECDYIEHTSEYFLDSIYTFQPDLILLQAQDASNKFNENIIAEVKELCPNALLVNWNGDYHPKNLLNPSYLKMLAMFDLCGFATTKFADVWDKAGVNWMYLQAGFEDYPEADKPVTGDNWDFVFLGNVYSQYRKELVQAIRSTGYKVGVFGAGKGIKTEGETLYDYPLNYQIYNSAKFAISDQQWPDATGYVSDRIFHAMRSGVTVLQQYFEGMEELMTLVDYGNIIVWKDFNDLKKKMQMCMRMAEKDRLGVGELGQHHIKNKYHYRNFVDRILDELGYE